MAAARQHSRDALHLVRCAVEREDGYRAGEQPGERRAAFCRLEHVVPWAIKGGHWEAGDVATRPSPATLRPLRSGDGDVYVSL